MPQGWGLRGGPRGRLEEPSHGAWCWASLAHGEEIAPISLGTLNEE